MIILFKWWNRLAYKDRAPISSTHVPHRPGAQPSGGGSQRLADYQQECWKKTLRLIQQLKGPFQHPNIRTLCYIFKQVSLLKPVESSQHFFFSLLLKPQIDYQDFRADTLEVTRPPARRKSP